MRAIEPAHLPARLPAHPAGMRWWLLLTLSLLLHWLLLSAAGNGIGMPAAGGRAPVVTVVTAGMVAAAVPAPAAPPTQASAAAPTTRPAGSPPLRRKTPPVPRPAAAVTPAPVSTAGTTRDEAATGSESLPTPADTSASAIPEPESPPGTKDIAPVTPTAIAEPPEGVPASLAKAAPAPDAAASAPPRYKVSLPPSATLSYEVRYATRGSITRGSSTVQWHSAGDDYAIRGEVSKFGLTLSAFRSEGVLDDAGIAPILYAEKNARRAETNTHFLRDARQAISFSAATNSFPLQPGAQDRASILWQLAGIARGQNELLVPGTMLDVVVAGVRDAEHWMIEIVGEETIELDTGTARAWHLVRAPRSGTYDKRIDIWLAPAQQWYPVKLRYTEQSGDYLDLSLSALR